MWKENCILSDAGAPQSGVEQEEKNQMKLNHHNCKPVMWLLFAAGVVCCLMTMASNLWAIPGILLFAAAVAVNFVFWRCPHCRKRLPGKISRNESCPYCGRSLL